MVDIQCYTSYSVRQGDLEMIEEVDEWDKIIVELDPGWWMRNCLKLRFENQHQWFAYIN